MINGNTEYIAFVNYWHMSYIGCDKNLVNKPINVNTHETLSTDN